MMSFNILVLISLSYVAFLFLVAFAAEKQAESGRGAWLRSPLIYTLSLSVYCTAWTFYGAVGYAARSGLEFVTIYLGPTLIMLAWWTILRKLVRIGRSQRITSIADLISSRYGKSNALGILTTLLAVIGTTPYIALQLQSVTLSFTVFSGGESSDLQSTALVVAAGLAIFTVIFGTRNLDANERHHGVVTAIAVEAVVKLCALVAVGVFVVWYVAAGPRNMAELIDESAIAHWNMDGSRWMTLTFLSAAAFLCLPRMFQVLVVENADERHLPVAAWAFPLYLFLMSLFVVPIAVVGLAFLPDGSNPDLFVLTVPQALGRDGLAMLAFLGGFSSATSMVIVAAIAVSTMVSNNIVLPIWLRAQGEGATVSGDVRQVVLLSRRLSIALILGLGYIYYRISGGGAALAAIGLIAFAGMAQVLPAMLGGIFWRGATRVGASAGLVLGFGIWLWSLFLPSLGDGGLLPPHVLTDGPFGMGWLRPQALFGIEGLDPVVHAVFWSMSFNVLGFVIGSLVSFPQPMERLQGAQFVNVWEYSQNPGGWGQSHVEAEDLLIMAQRIIGPNDAQALFQAEAASQGKAGYLPEPTTDFVQRLEKELAGSVGAATAHAMMAPLLGGSSVSVEDLMAVADEAQQILEYSNQLEAKSAELGRTARQLRSANEKLTALSIQKDAFLSQISHELRTPMTSIRAFSEILMDGESLTAEDRVRYSQVIHDEAIRLTRLLDDLLDLSVLEHGQVALNLEDLSLSKVLDRAVGATDRLEPARPIEIKRDRQTEDVQLRTDADRLAQVFINLIANAKKYCDADRPELQIRVRQIKGGVTIDLVDNGSGIPSESQELIFEKFARVSDTSKAGGAGLGLAICREIVTKLGGTVDYLPGQAGAAFRIVLPNTAQTQEEDLTVSAL
ncbi:MAG: ATP-binding protein [Pseudomonadota bacterium]